MIGHQAKGPDVRARCLRRLLEKITLESAVAIVEKGLRPPIAALGDMMGKTGEDETGKTGAGRNL
jgi:hypothetical protein